MCGIVGAIAERNTVPVLMEGLRRLEYRGYDSAGLAVVDADQQLLRRRALGKVVALADRLEEDPVQGSLGIAHTRWATHGEPSEVNAHPHVSKRVALVHNGIIENHAELRARLEHAGYHFESATDTEVAAHLIDLHLRDSDDLLAAVQQAITELNGAFALAVISPEYPDRLIGARRGSPLLVGLGIGENFLGSDVFALLPVTQRFMFLEEGDVVELTRTTVKVIATNGAAVERAVHTSELSVAATDRGTFRHFMLKEIFEQPEAVTNTLEGRLLGDKVLDSGLGERASELLDRVRGVHLIACGTSAHAGLVARYWYEEMGVPCSVDLASEYRYRSVVVPPGTLLVTVSQSGETADTLAALRKAKSSGRYLATMAVCNAPESSLVRESDLTLLTRAGPEIGVASTKAFTTQLVALALLGVALGRRCGLDDAGERRWVKALRALPERLRQVLLVNDAIARAAEHFVEKHHALFLGRGPLYPIAMEGALKLKEISYIHAEAYAAGELKHGPLALVDADMPVICVLPTGELLEKVLSNLEEVRARGGELFLLGDAAGAAGLGGAAHVLPLPSVEEELAPMVFALPLQLLAYHVAVLRGTDVDQPRNLAKSVTVE
jgi:glucosamine--fructose-6-phosphate aminotransferase (isomerizing)